MCKTLYCVENIPQCSARPEKLALNSGLVFYNMYARCVGGRDPKVFSRYTIEKFLKVILYLFRPEQVLKEFRALGIPTMS